MKIAQGDLILTSFFEDVSPAARAWSDRFDIRHKAMPSQIQAGVYSAVRHYLRQGHQLGRRCGGDGADEGNAGVRRHMQKGRYRDDQRIIHDLYLVQVKTPES